MEKQTLDSLNITAENITKIAELFPSAVSEGKINFEILKTLLGETIDDSNERYQFGWNGKHQAMQLAQTPSTGTLLPNQEKSKNWDETENVYIEGDNLEVLKLLQKSYFGKIKMIYIDPPYNTGKDFVYKDSFQDTIQNYKEQTNQTTKANAETSGRYHTDWLNMMYPRLMLARNLLTEDGVIFISIDEIEQSNLRKISDEIFGEENHVADFVWRNKRGGGNDAKYVAVEHEYVLMYAKSIQNLSELFVPFNPAYLKRYKEEDEIGLYFWDTFKRKSGKQYYPITCPDGTVLENDEYGNPISWLRSERRFLDDLNLGEIRIVKNNDKWSVQFKQRIPQGKKPRSIFLEESIFEQQGTTSNGSAEVLNIFGANLFSNPKPINLIKHLLTFDTKNDDIILDFFSGSSTTAHAVMQLNAEDGGNRKYIMVQIPENTPEKSEAAKAGYTTIPEIAQERIRRAGELILNDDSLPQANRNNLDTGFKVFTLDSSNVKPYDPTQLFADAETFVDGRSELAICYELVLKSGLALTTPIQQRDGIYVVDEGLLFISLADQITVETAEAIINLADVDLNPRVIFKDTGFSDDATKLNVLRRLQTAGISEVRSV